MKKTVHISTLIITALVAVLMAAPAQAASPQRPEEKIITLINQERAKAGVAPLVRDGEMDKIARDWTNKMLNQNRLFHNPNLMDNVQSYKGNGWDSIGENVAMVCNYGSQTINEVFKRWNASTMHRANMVRDNYEAHGFGYGVDNGGCFWMTSVFYAGKGIVSPVDPEYKDIFIDSSGSGETAPPAPSKVDPVLFMATGTLYRGGTYKKPAGSTLHMDIRTSHDGVVQRLVNGKWVDHYKIKKPHASKNMPLSKNAGTTTYRMRFYHDGAWETFKPFKVTTTKKKATVAKAKVSGFKTGTVSTKKKTYTDKVTLSHKGYLQKYTGKKWVNVKTLKKGANVVKIKSPSKKTAYRIVIKKSSKNTSVTTKSMYIKKKATVAKAKVSGFKTGTVSTKKKTYTDKVTLSHKGYLQKYTGKKWVNVKTLKKGANVVKIKSPSKQTAYRIVIKKSSKNTSVTTKRMYIKKKKGSVRSVYIANEQTQNNNAALMILGVAFIIGTAGVVRRQFN